MIVDFAFPVQSSFSLMSFPYLPLNDTLAIQLVAPFYHPGPANELFMNTHATVTVKHIII